MINQKCVCKKIIWAIGMIVICTFLTFFLSDFIGKFFPNVSMVCRVLVPVVIFVLLGAASSYLKEFALPKVESFLSIPAVKGILPCILVIFTLIIQQFYFRSHTFLWENQEILDIFLVNGRICIGWDGILLKMYQIGLKPITTLLGFTSFSISIYNRILVWISAILFYAAICLLGKNRVMAPLFACFFLLGKPALEFTIKPDVTVLYYVFLSIYFFALSFGFSLKRKKENFLKLGISGFISIILFALLIWVEPKSIVFILPAFCMIFCQYETDKKKIYWIYAGILNGGFLLVSILGFLTGHITLASFIVEMIEIANNSGFAIVAFVLNLIGFLGVFGMWNPKLYYLIPYGMAVYFICFGKVYDSGIDSIALCFLSLVFYAVLGIGTLEVKSSVKENSEEEIAMEEYDTENQEIESIRKINEKLNQTEANFVPLTFKQPKRQERKEITYIYEPTVDEMKYDIEVSEDDDFDV